MGKFFRRGGAFLLVLCLVLAGTDAALTKAGPMEGSDLVTHNDFEKTILAHDGRTVYDRVFYGNSVVISAYLEEESTSGYVNFGIDYGVMTDLWGMLRRGDITVTEDLVIGLNYFVFLDTMDTNPTYPWHRGLLEPYVYFQRDRFQEVWEKGWTSLWETGRVAIPRNEDPGKIMYSGAMDDQALEEKIATHRDLYWGLGVEYYQENLKALENVADFCEEKGIRLRAVWLPWNPYLPMPENPARVRAQADRIMEAAGVEILDLENALPRDCFHDLGHLNREHGAYVFTEVMDRWLV